MVLLSCRNTRIIIRNMTSNNLTLSCAIYYRAPRYGGVRTWVQGLLARRERTLAEASNLMGCKPYRLYKSCAPHGGDVCSMQGVPQWRLWAPYVDPLQCCMFFYRDPNYLQPILSPWGYLPQDSGGSTVLHSDKKKSGYTVEY